jgi:hypothetical protein
MNVQLGRIRKDRTLQKWYTTLAFFCRGWDKPQTKGMWGRAWDLNRHQLNTWLKCYCFTRLVCVENIVLHKISIKVAGVACSVQTEVWSWYLFMMYNQTMQQTGKKKLLTTNCTSQNTQDWYSDMCRLLRVAIFSEYISQTYSQQWQMTYHLISGFHCAFLQSLSLLLAA